MPQDNIRFVLLKHLRYKSSKTELNLITQNILIQVFEGREMIWCPHCRRKGEASHDHSTGIM